MKNGHDGDCAIFSSLANGRCWDGICTCGYGLARQRQTGDDTHLTSEERKRQAGPREVIICEPSVMRALKKAALKSPPARSGP